MDPKWHSHLKLVYRNLEGMNLILKSVAQMTGSTVKLHQEYQSIYLAVVYIGLHREAKAKNSRQL
jgi:hypothetical protein